MMERFDVEQRQQGLWSIISQGVTLDLYSTEEEARSAALALALNRCASGCQASVTITPAHQVDRRDARTEFQRFTGM